MPLSLLTQPSSVRRAVKGSDKENSKSAVRKSASAGTRRRRARPTPKSLAAKISSPAAAAEHAADRAVRRGSHVTIVANVPVLSSTTTEPPKTISYNFPRQLPRFGIPRVRDEAISAVDPKLKGIPLEYLHHSLRGMESLYVFVAFFFFACACSETIFWTLTLRLQQGLAAISCDPSLEGRRDLPGEFTLLVRPDFKSGRLPTHIFVAMDMDGKRGTMFPFHDLVLATHCASLPPLPYPDDSTAPKPEVRANSSITITLPIVPVRLPNPEFFKPIYDYLYNKNSGRLLSVLLPLPSSAMPRRDSATSSSDSSPPEEFKTRVSEALATTFTLQTLVQQARNIHGLWSDVVALGITDLGLWNIMDFAWAVLLNAMTLAGEATRS